MAKFKITDPNTGKTITLEGDSPPSEQELEQIFASQNSEPQKQQNQNPLFDFLKDRVNKANKTLGAELNEQGQVTGINRDQVLQSTLGIGALPQAGVAATKAALPGIKSLMDYLTKAGVGKKIEQAAQTATKAGKTDTFSDIATELRQTVQDKLGNLPEYGKVVNQRLSSITPSSIEGQPTLNPLDLLKTRQQAANREPQGIFKLFQGKSPENQVDELLRQVASGRLKETAGTGKLDKLYSIYSNPIFSKIGIPFTPLNISAGPTAGVPAAGINALLGLFGLNKGKEFIK